MTRQKIHVNIYNTLKSIQFSENARVHQWLLVGGQKKSSLIFNANSMSRSWKAKPLPACPFTSTSTPVVFLRESTPTYPHSKTGDSLSFTFWFFSLPPLSPLPLIWNVQGVLILWLWIYHVVYIAGPFFSLYFPLVLFSTVGCFVFQRHTNTVFWNKSLSSLWFSWRQRPIIISLPLP